MICTPKVVSLSSNVELVTAIANDIGFEDAASTHCGCMADAVTFW